MTDETALDRAHAAMMADEESEAARMAFYAALRAAELFVLLEAEPVGDKAELLVMETEDGPVGLAFDTEARMAEFVEAPTPYLGLSGRKLVEMLAGQGVALGVNLGVASSSSLLGADGVDWIAETAPSAPDVVDAVPEEIFRPEVPEVVLRALDAGLARLSGLAGAAWLVGARYAGGQRGVLLAIGGVLDEGQAAVADVVAEALAYSGAEAAALDILFLDGTAMAERLETVGLRFDIPEPELAAPVQRDVNRPPRLI
ncbi:SseB family protein [Algicella marina]|uniref:SseB family protein n=1 Tax=Algicella marina TaxID=2683284 RepID=A0A6P1T1I5_9RHOB|nr:SseB family protein [Algicella marina]QHQ35503.1 SseB family protein [Algicella marina]